MEPDAEPGMAADWERFSHWLHCVCIVTFDLELGQAIEAIYPPHVKLTEKEKTSTCYLAFPDSNSGCHGDTQFTFRFRQSPSRRAIADVIHDVDMPVLLQRDPHYFYGYVYFRQVKDNSLKRGYFQKSLVLLSRLPFVNLFSSVAKLVAPEYFEKLEPCLEAACKDIDRWPNPIPGKTLNLPIMGLVIQVRIPSRSDKFSACTLKQDVCENMLPAPLVLSSVHEGDMFRALQPVLPHLQLLWELVLLGEPLVVMATSPAATADTVLALVSSISPLRYSSDFRPYFTIHDSEFREITSQKQAPPSVILGVTNPFFVKTLQQWPHIVRVGDLRGPADASKQTKIKKVNKLRSLDAKPGVYTSHKTYLTKDRAIIKRLQKGAQRKRPSEVQNAILRRYLMELTHSFIIPLERYVASLMPLQKSITPWKSPPQVGPFVPEEFFKSLEHAGPQLTSVLKGDWVGLYRQFLRSPNFDTWFRARHSEMTQKLELLQLEALLRADLKLWLEHKSEVEVVDMVIKLQDKMESAQQAGIAVRPDMFERLQALVDTAVQGLPADLQHVLQRT